MAKLTTLKPRIATLEPRIGYLSGDEAERSRYRRRTQAWRQWYGTARWQKLRWEVLVRDCFTCARCKRVSGNKGEAVADHIKPHRGDERLFWDPSNLQCVCQPCHDSIRQAEDKAMRNNVA